MAQASKPLNINNRPVSTRVVIGSYGPDRGGEGGRFAGSAKFPPLVQPPKNFMKKAQPNKQETKQEQPPTPPEWPRMGKTAPGRQPQNPRILRVVLEEEVVNVQVRSNSFYRANEPVLVGVDAGGALVAVKPKTNPLLHGGYEG